MAKKKIKLAINGFGRIGRAAFKVALEHKNIEVVAINDLTDAGTLAYLLKNDTAYGRYDAEIKHADGYIQVNRNKYAILGVPDPAKIPWRRYNPDVVLECTGRFRTEVMAAAHLKGGAKKVIISAPAKGGNVGTFVLGVNDDNYQKERVINNASCTTNCVAPIAQVIHQAFGVTKAALTTIHSYTADQLLQDGPHKDLRRGRAAAQNIVPTSTGAAKATTETIPELKGLFDGIAMRVPTIVGSLSDFTFLLAQNVTVEQVNKVLEKASSTKKFKGIIKVSREPLVSSDIIGESASCVVDLTFTQVIDGNLVKVIAWYDNEWGYANRLVEMAQRVAQ
ncbi:MAG: type I glyceraldehyde-3-phosphate dehydrogenase [Candidatus Komeilibacteria bacterium]|nr:type I glyceraldehyde-3-phosphate dehydrogenase [Candidatus Komeilibacteria bacterium]